MSTGMKALAVVVGNHMTKRYEDVAKTAADRDYWKGLYFAQMLVVRAADEGAPPRWCDNFLLTTLFTTTNSGPTG